MNNLSKKAQNMLDKETTTRNNSESRLPDKSVDKTKTASTMEKPSEPNLDLNWHYNELAAENSNISLKSPKMKGKLYASGFSSIEPHNQGSINV
mmetsp:Transcript_15693/g.21245  ORF Transcript_15693/g.21245 Transcript_15693/m.21245 type:complete len:94 (-) Transcript_15693:216-497(-)